MIASVVVIGAIMSILDATIVNVALATLSRDLHAWLSTIAHVPPGLRTHVAEPLAHAFTQTFWWAVAPTAAALLPAGLLAFRVPGPTAARAQAGAAQSA